MVDWSNEAQYRVMDAEQKDALRYFLIWATKKATVWSDCFYKPYIEHAIGYVSNGEKNCAFRELGYEMQWNDAQPYINAKWKWVNGGVHKLCSHNGYYKLYNAYDHRPWPRDRLLIVPWNRPKTKQEIQRIFIGHKPIVNRNFHHVIDNPSWEFPGIKAWCSGNGSILLFETVTDAVYTALKMRC